MREITTRDWEDLNRRVARLEALMHALAFNNIGGVHMANVRRESDNIGAKAIERAMLEQKGKAIPIRHDGTPNIKAIYERDYDHG
jgi:hypothetical protein